MSFANQEREKPPVQCVEDVQLSIQCQDDVYGFGCPIIYDNTTTPSKMCIPFLTDDRLQSNHRVYLTERPVFHGETSDMICLATPNGQILDSTEATTHGQLNVTPRVSPEARRVHTSNTDPLQALSPPTVTVGSFHGRFPETMALGGVGHYRSWQMEEEEMNKYPKGKKKKGKRRQKSR